MRIVHIIYIPKILNQCCIHMYWLQHSLILEYLGRQNKSDDGHEESGKLFSVEDEVEDLLKGSDLRFGVALFEIGLEGHFIWRFARQIWRQLHQGVAGELSEGRHFVHRVLNVSKLIN